MKRPLTKITLVILALVISLTGAGTTIAHFCCDDCSSNFWAKMHPVASEDDEEAHSCCSAKKKECASDCTAQHKKGEKCCCLKRYSTTLDSYHAKPAVTTPFTWIENISHVFAAGLIHTDKAKYFLWETDDPPNIPSPREYLSLISILII